MSVRPIRLWFCPSHAIAAAAHALTLALGCSVALAGDFVYEGRLDDFGKPATGRYDLRLSAFGDASHGALLAPPLTFEAVEVKDGRFRIDFELPLPDVNAVWLEVAVRESGAAAFSAIPGRAKAAAAPLIGACWSTTGDSGSNASTNFIGTTDARAFVVRTHNVRSLRIDPSTVLVAGQPITANMIAGSSENSTIASARGATIAGGGAPAGGSDPDYTTAGPNRVTGHFGSVGGGLANRAGDLNGDPLDGDLATVGGGLENVASGFASVVGGGVGNVASGTHAGVAGGAENTASGSRSAIAGGSGNDATGESAAVSGGADNTASGLLSMASGGARNCAGGTYSWSGGRRAKARPGSGSGVAGFGCQGVPASGDVDGDNGTFLWADSQDADFVSTGANQFLVRASGGMVVTGGLANDPLGNRLRVHGGTLRVDQLGAAGSQDLCRNSDNQLATCSSSARYKDEISELGLGLEAAQRLHAVGYRWKGSGEADVGFVAEEVAAIDERLVTRNERGEVEGVKYDRLTAVLANAVQELAARVSLASDSLGRIEAAHDALAAETLRLRARLEALEAERDGRR